MKDKQKVINVGDKESYRTQNINIQRVGESHQRGGVGYPIQDIPLKPGYPAGLITPRSVVQIHPPLPCNFRFSGFCSVFFYNACFWRI
jgi:hypothetical protein